MSEMWRNREQHDERVHDVHTEADLSRKFEMAAIKASLAAGVIGMVVAGMTGLSVITDTLTNKFNKTDQATSETSLTQAIAQPVEAPVLTVRERLIDSTNRP